MTIFVNRILNMKSIKAIGLDMDYTLVRYKTENFERLSHTEALKKLVSEKGYPKEILKLKFHFNLIIQGLVIDRVRGNIIQVNRYGKVKIAYHGQTKLQYDIQKETYGNYYVELGTEQFESLDTNFAKSYGTIFAQLVDLKDQGLDLPDYETMTYDAKDMIDLVHIDGTLKNQVRDNFSEYIDLDPDVVTLLERFKAYDKKLLLITNSDFAYTKVLLEKCINPYLKYHKNWEELFDYTVTLANKPNFFQQKSPFLKIQTDTGLMSNTNGNFGPGVYQGGCGHILQDHLKLKGSEILYLGDHIYGDVVKLKKCANWRTGLILDSLQGEVESIKKSQETQSEIDSFMAEKESIEYTLNQLELKKHIYGEKTEKKLINEHFNNLEKINSNISQLLEEYRSFFNPHWGQIMRSGQEESWFAEQVERYACIYMSHLSDLLQYSPRTYFRPLKRVLPHEIQKLDIN